MDIIVTCEESRQRSRFKITLTHIRCMAGHPGPNSGYFTVPYTVVHGHDGHCHMTGGPKPRAEPTPGVKLFEEQ